MKRRISLVLVVLLMLTMIVGTAPALATAKVKTVISLSHSGTVTLNIGDSLQLSATVTPEAPITWTSGKPKVATVDASGRVHAAAEGTATIKAKAGGKSKSIKIKVVDPWKPTKVTIAQGKTITVNIGEPYQLNAVLAPATARATLAWKSSKPKVATVDASGLVTGVKKGKTTVTVKAGKKSAKIKVNVVAGSTQPGTPAVTGITLSHSGTIEIPVGGTLTLSYTLQPAGAQGTVTWKSSKTKVATVADGIVTAKTKGTATITVKCGKKSAKVKVKVVAPEAHQHTWEPIYTPTTVVDTPAWDETVIDSPAWDETVIDTPAHTETVQHPEEGHYTTVHHDEQGHYETQTIVDKPEWTEEVPIETDIWVVDKPAWTETTKKVAKTRCGCGMLFDNGSAWTEHNKRNDLVEQYNSGFWDGNDEAKRAIEQAYGNPPKGEYGDNPSNCHHYGSAYVDVPVPESEWIEHPEEGHWFHTLTGEYKTVVHPAETHTEQVWVVDKQAWDEQVWIVDKPAWTETVEVPAVTHVVHHDAVTHTVHHDAVTHVENVQTGSRCTGCGAIQ